MPELNAFQRLVARFSPKADANESTDDAPESPGISTAEAFSSPDAPLESREPVEAPAPEVPDFERRLTEEAERREKLEKELEFLRLQQTQAQRPVEPPAPDPVAQVMDMLRVDEETWTEMVADPKRGAAISTDALQKLFLLSQEVAARKLGPQFQEALKAEVENLKREQYGNQLRDAFWNRNTALQPYAPVVQHFSSQVAQEAVGKGWDGDTIIGEISKRSRAQLKAWGVDIEGENKKASKSRIRPAAADMGGGTPESAPRVNHQQQRILQMLGKKVA